MARLNRDKALTEKKAAFAANFGTHLMNQTEAARVAGYADPNGEIARLMADPAVVARVIDLLRKQAVKWQVLVVKAKKTLFDAMDSMTFARTGKDEFSEVDDTRARLEAARIVLMTLKRDGKALLEDAAGEEDAAAETSIDLAKRILGAPVPGETVN